MLSHEDLWRHKYGDSSLRSRMTSGERCLHRWTPRRVSIFCIIFQTNHLLADRFFKILKTKDIVCKVFKTLALWFLWSFWGDTSLRPVDSVSYALERTGFS